MYFHEAFTGMMFVVVIVTPLTPGFGPPGGERELSADGYELRWAVDYLAPVALTTALLPTLRHNAHGQYARIVNIGSIGQYPIDFRDVNLDEGYSGVNAYRNGDPGIATGWSRWLPKWVEPKAPSPQVGFGPIGEFIMPLWIPTAFGLLCAYFLLPERGPRHLCEKCKYDLRAVPAKAGLITCPECGRTSDAPAANPEGTP